MALLWVLNLSDGRHSLLDIAERSGLGFAAIADAADALAGQRPARARRHERRRRLRRPDRAGDRGDRRHRRRARRPRSPPRARRCTRWRGGARRTPRLSSGTRVDLEDEAAVERFAAGLADAAAGLDVLVHAAGLYADRRRRRGAARRARPPVAGQPPRALAADQGALPRCSRGAAARSSSSIRQVWGEARAGIGGYAGQQIRAEGARRRAARRGQPRRRPRAQRLPRPHRQPHAGGGASPRGPPYRPEALLQPDDVAEAVLAALALPRPPR